MMNTTADTTRRRRRMVAGLFAAGVATLLGLLSASPAAASTGPGGADGILVSTDGTHFASAMSSALFDPTGLVVPGAKQTASLYIRNVSTHPAVVALHATKLAFSTPELARLLELEAFPDRGVSGPVVRLSEGQCLPLVSNLSVPAGSTTHVNLNLMMSAGAQGSDGQNQHAHFDILISARDRTEPAIPATGCSAGVSLPGTDSADPADASNGMADTGSDLLVPLAGASVLFGIGAALVIATRRSRRGTRQERDS